MRILYQTEQLYPGKVFPGSSLYKYFEQSEARASRLHWFDFQTYRAHTLNVCYPEPFYKLALCIAGNSRSAPRLSKEYSFSTGQAIFYKTEDEPYLSFLPADTTFKVIHIHLSDLHVATLRNELPQLLEKPGITMSLSPECTAAFYQLKTIEKEKPFLLRLFEEKLITDQLYEMASKLTPRGGGKDILQEAIWHIHQTERYLTIAELAQLTGTNSFRIKQVFREQLRSTVFQYQSDLHMERAARLLLDTTLSVSEVSLRCGYESAAAFSNSFLKKFGVRPLAFKNSR